MFVLLLYQKDDVTKKRSDTRIQRETIGMDKYKFTLLVRSKKFYPSLNLLFFLPDFVEVKI